MVHQFARQVDKQRNLVPFTGPSTHNYDSYFNNKQYHFNLNLPCYWTIQCNQNCHLNSLILSNSFQVSLHFSLYFGCFNQSVLRFILNFFEYTYFQLVFQVSNMNLNQYFEYNFKIFIFAQDHYAKINLNFIKNIDYHFLKFIIVRAFHKFRTYSRYFDSIMWCYERRFLKHLNSCSLVCFSFLVICLNNIDYCMLNFQMLSQVGNMDNYIFDFQIY